MVLGNNHLIVSGQRCKARDSRDVSLREVHALHSVDALSLEDKGMFVDKVHIFFVRTAALVQAIYCMC